MRKYQGDYEGVREQIIRTFQFGQDNLEEWMKDVYCPDLSMAEIIKLYAELGVVISGKDPHNTIENQPQEVGRREDAASYMKYMQFNVQNH